MSPAVGQVWRVYNSRWLLREKRVNEKGQVDFTAMEVNGNRRATITQELLEDANPMCVEYIETWEDPFPVKRT